MSSKSSKVHVDGEAWSYRVGKQYVTILSPAGVRTNVPCGVLTGRDFERGQWKRTTDGAVFPSDVRTYVAVHLRGRRAA